MSVEHSWVKKEADPLLPFGWWEYKTSKTKICILKKKKPEFSAFVEMKLE